jgi:very-short-patch-repair endonuclease
MSEIIPSLTPEYVIHAYQILNHSTYNIAKDLKTYPNKIRDILINSGVSMRTKAEAQSIALKRGDHPHPTKGKKRNAETKAKISKGVAERWEQVSEVEREARSEKAKTNWEAMSDEDKKKLRRASAAAIQRTSKNGSFLERFLLLELNKRGFNTQFHVKNIVANEQLEADLYLPEMNIVIEIDGPTHFLPIWGEENLIKHMLADKQKNGLLMEKGFKIIRIKYLARSYSRKVGELALTKVLEAIQCLGESEPIIELEVK